MYLLDVCTMIIMHVLCAERVSERVGEQDNQRPIERSSERSSDRWYEPLSD